MKVKMKGVTIQRFTISPSNPPAERRPPGRSLAFSETHNPASTPDLSPSLTVGSQSEAQAVDTGRGL